MSDERYLAPRLRRCATPPPMTERNPCEVATGLKRVVRLGAEPHHEVGEFHHFLSDVGVMVEHQRDRRCPHHRADLAQYMAFEVVDSFGACRTVQHHHQTVEGPRVGEPRRDSSAQVIERRPGQTASGLGISANDWHRLNVLLGGCDSIQVARDGPGRIDVSQHIIALKEAEAREV